MQPSDPVAQFRAVLAGDDVAPGLLAVQADEMAQRVAIYRNNVAHSLKQALARRYPVVERLVGADFFTAMAAPFIADHPPRTPVMQEWGAVFASFLAGFPPVAGLPYLPDVARIEWARGMAYHAADAAPLPPADLSPDRPLCLHPSLHLVRSDHPAFDIWQVNQPGGDGICRGADPQIALIWRRPDFQVMTEAVSATDARIITALQGGEALSVAAQNSDPVPVLTRLLRDGLICSELSS